MEDKPGGEFQAVAVIPAPYRAGPVVTIGKVGQTNRQSFVELVAHTPSRGDGESVRFRLFREVAMRGRGLVVANGYRVECLFQLGEQALFGNFVAAHEDLQVRV